MSAVLRWVKSNVYIVIFVVLMLAAAVAMPIIAGGMNARVRDKVDGRVKQNRELAKLEKTDFTPPWGGESQKLLVNKRFLSMLEDVVRQRKEDARKVYQAAVEHNSKGRGVLVPALLPKPPLADRQVLQNEFFEELRDAFEGLLREINAGSPPDPTEVLEVLQRKQANTLSQKFFTDSVDALNDEDRRILEELLLETRTATYVQAAESLSMYASLAGLVLPPTDGSYLPSLGEIYDWQWTFWIVEDIARGLARANEESPSVILAPVKRVLSVQVEGQGALNGAGADSSDDRRGSGTPAAPLNPKLEATLDFSASLTGRRTNPLYDVRYVDLSLIIDAEQLPRILDALATQNFITPVDLTLTPIDAFDAVRQGYFYGSGQIAQLDLRLETIWLREWMIPFMPDEVRTALGIPLEQKPQQPAAG